MQWQFGAGLALIAAVLILLPPFILPEYITTSIILVLFGCYLAQCWNLVAGYAGQLSLGHPLFIAIGAYTSSILFERYGVTPWLGMSVGGAIASVVGAILTVVAVHYRVKDIFFALITLAATEMSHGLFEHWEFVGASRGIYLTLSGNLSSMTLFSRAPYHIIISSMVIMLIVVTWLMSRSKFGQYLMALREDEAAAAASGVPTFRCKVLIMAFSAFFAALGGTFYAQYFLYIAPETLFGFDHMLGMILGRSN